ncbi:hypothetical protein WKH57_25060 [Niallia taxi]
MMWRLTLMTAVKKEEATHVKDACCLYDASGYGHYHGVIGHWN